MNRFSKDVGFLDDLLPYIYTEFVLVCANICCWSTAWIQPIHYMTRLSLIGCSLTPQLSFRCLAIIMTTLVANWWTLLPAAVLMLGLVLIRGYYLKTGREVKRLEAVGRHGSFGLIATRWPFDLYLQLGVLCTLTSPPLSKDYPLSGHSGGSTQPKNTSTTSRMSTPRYMPASTGTLLGP